MNAWIQVDASFRTHRKTRRIARALGKDARRLPIWLWLYCVESARDGDLSNLTDADLADVLDFDGDATKLRAALIEAEFLTESGMVVGWESRYAAKFKFYQERASKAATARWERQSSPSTPPPITDQTILDQTRGEEIKKHAQASSKDASSMLTNPAGLLPFASAEFSAAWADFCQHRKEIKKKLTPTATAQILADLAAWGEPRAIAAIRHTIGKGWQGIREDDRSSAPRRGGSELAHRIDGFPTGKSEFSGRF